jgi:glycosyltransferase involved in cell wall biosynthesis
MIIPLAPRRLLALRIVFFIASTQCGGAERVAATLASAWARGGHAVTLATWEEPGTVPFFAPSAAVELVQLGVAGATDGVVEAVAANLRRLRAVRRCVRERGADVVVAFGDTTNVTVLLALTALDVPVVVTERVDPARWPLPAPWPSLRRRLYPRAARVVVQTEGAAAFFAALPRPPVVIPNPVPAPRRDRDGDAVRPRILGVGRLVPQKGFDLLLEAFARVAPSFPEWELRIAGDGPERDALEDLARRLGVAGRVRLLGRVEPIEGELRAAQVFVLSSRFEGFPNALAEAMAHGLAVISSDCPSGPSDLVRDGVDGLLVPPEDAGALAEALAALLADPARRASLASRAGEVVARFSEDAIVERWCALLDDVVGDRV